jgi:predicted Na+-dependent transporter
MLLAIVFNVFSDTFVTGIGVQGPALMTLMLTLPCAYLAFNALFWSLSWKLLPNLDMKIRATALLLASQKTLSFGIPFIKTAMGTRPDIAYLLAPLLIYAPVQLLLGSSLLVPFLQHMIRQEEGKERIQEQLNEK